MDEIIVCTEKDEYAAGDTVYGCVYMKIGSPVGANGVLMRMLGYEHYTFNTQYTEEGEQCKGDQCVRSIQDMKEHIKREDVQLYSSSSAIRCGHYLFPFKIVLPPRIPGSFHFESDVLKASVVYQIVCELEGSSDIQGSKELTVHETSTICNSSVTKSVNLNDGWFLSSSIQITSSLNKSSYYAGETAQLSIDFLPSGKVNIEKVDIALVRNVALTTRHLSPTGHNFTETLWRGEITSESGVRLQKGLRNFMVPLRCDQGSLPASTFGSHIICSYCLNIDVTVNGSVVELCQSIPNVKSRPVSPGEEEPDWAPRCQWDYEFKHKYAITPQDHTYFKRLTSANDIIASKEEFIV